MSVTPRDRGTSAHRQQVATLVSLALMVSLLVAFGSGVLLGSHDGLSHDSGMSRIHVFSSYGVLWLSGLHVFFHWRTLTARVQRWLLSYQSSTRPTMRAVATSVATETSPDARAA